MEHQRKLTPYFFFITLGVLIALITSVSAFLNLIFETLNHAFPDVLTDSYQSGYYSYAFDAIRSALSILIIFFPIYLILENRWYKAATKTLSHFDEILRRWAIYLILFMASLTVLIDLVILVQYFVSGEITTRFILKVAVTLVTAALVGWYYIRRLSNPSEKKWNIVVTSIATVLVIASIVWAFSVIGGPASQRTLRLDQRRLEDLQSIQYSVINYWQQSEMLPKDLATLSTPLSNYTVPRDPEFQKGMQYEYRALDSKSFELCATFAAPLPEGWVPGQGYSGSSPLMMEDTTSSSFPGSAQNNTWAHEIGRTCYTRTIDPVFYPPFPKSAKQ
ncbi:hypothetical protein K2Q02_01760 [Patescibacteria group bacterium]|nr:hypothetical protein [Patescibacteria group bacterium]